jgi:hypothetical protein
LTPATADFATVRTGAKRTLDFTVTNDGTALLIVHDAHLAGPNPGEYSIAKDDCSGVSVAVNASCTVAVAFAPTTDGQKAASLVVHSNDPDLPSVTSSLTGTGAEVRSILVRLVTRPATTNSVFSFTVNGGITKFQLPANGVYTRVLGGLAPGSYKITESASPHWALADLTCTSSQSIDLAHRSVTIQVASSRTVDCTFVNSLRVADAMIATAPNGPFIGNDVYSSVPITQETAHKVVPPGTLKSVWVVLQNDAIDRDSFAVSASYTGSSQFQVKIWRGSVDITAKLLAGGYSLNGMAPGGQVKLRISIQAAAGAPLTAAGELSVLMRSKSAPASVDVVEADVSAK